MRANVPILSDPARRRTLLHVLFWITILIILTVIYGAGMPGYGLALGVVAMFMPIHMLYFYCIAYFLIPRFFNRKRYVEFVIYLILCIILSTLVFRFLEILVADPIVYAAVRKTDPTFVWVKLQGSFREQLSRPVYLINAFEQTNIFVWIALSIKFFKMWFERRQAAIEAELNFLKGQLHPHFLFNTLNNLYALTLTQSPQSPAVVMGLAEILRYMLYEANTDIVELERDIRIVESYIELEKIRYEERLDINFSINGLSPGFKIAPLLLLPLVENAFKHGASEQVGQAWINIDLRIKNNNLKFKIANSKPETTVKEVRKHHVSIGLANVRKRLDILYPSAHQLRILEEDDVFAVILEIELDKRLEI
ncbi:sensor histidine kinase [Dyadobacter sp. Leaf189]|uniref:sensor histidine kinase n=1 Tax=Dyadobacter sp. Leaf189 TaxID=1736295 RepID=UPI0006FB2D19|nr:histidine kinase [Dyadobacter sp. Leaf189]KQS33201.1 histidine kinase [Dyadobacter sp. Leaf189]